MTAWRKTTVPSMGLVTSRSGVVSFGLEDRGQGRIVEAKVPELLLGVEQAGPGLVHRERASGSRLAPDRDLMSSVRCSTRR